MPSHVIAAHGGAVVAAMIVGPLLASVVRPR
jgi:hypothetical protein